MNGPALHRNNSRSPLRLGFVPLSDCAPIAVANETGIFERYGLNVKLSRELGWASIRDKVYYGDLDAAQSIAGIALSLGLGFTDLRCEVVVPLVLNLNGNAITISSSLKASDIGGKGENLKHYLTHSWKKDRPFTLAVPHRFSSHHILLHRWFRSLGLNYPDDSEILFLPPSLMPRLLKAGHIDGYCVGEPWNSESILTGDGWCPATSAELSPGHPEKVLLVAGRFQHEHRDETVALVAALLEACRICQDPAFRSDLVSILAMKNYTGASPEVLQNSLERHLETNRFPFSNSSSFNVFHGETVNSPTVEKALWVLAGLRDIGTLPDITCGSLSRIFRQDIYLAATSGGLSA